MLSKKSSLYLMSCLIGGQAFAGALPATTVLVTGGLDKPVWVTAAPKDWDRVFVLEQRGVIRVIREGNLMQNPFLDINSLVIDVHEDEGERGLLGLAFHPRFANNGFFYVSYVDVENNTKIVRYKANPDAPIADPDSAVAILTIQTQVSNHTGGWLAFGPDGYLYIATGDGGSAFDTGNRTQDTDQLLGKLLRINVDQDDFLRDPERNYAIPPNNPFIGIEGDDEIWAYGLRNPWRNAFDSLTGDLYIADVGQNAQEEINFQVSSSSGGQDYGWRCMEGNLCTGLHGCDCNDPTFTPPIYVYNHTDSPQVRCRVIGGDVYRGCAIPAFDGMYFFADYCSGEIWTLELSGKDNYITDRTSALAPHGGHSIAKITSIGRDAFGELYITDRDDGEVYKIVPLTLTPDCNHNSRVDACDIVGGFSVDADDNGTPDECGSVIQIHSSIPPTGTIDARQPSNLDGTNPSGLAIVDLTFSGSVAGLTVGDFTVIQMGSGEPVPTVVSADPLGDSSIRLTLSHPIAVFAWTDIMHQGSGTFVRLGYLPGDVNGDQTTSPTDILALIDALNGVIQRSIWSTDIDRSGMANPADILREIDLLNGADAFDVYNLAMLP